MTELARTPPAFRRLFETVDLAPLPQHAVVLAGLDAWRERRGPSLAPRVSDMLRDETAKVLNHSFLAETVRGTDDFAVVSAGEWVGPELGLRGTSGRLSELTAVRLAARLRRLFALVLERGEPIAVRFTDRRRNFEILAAPMRTASDRPALFCTVALDERVDVDDRG